MVLLIVLTAKAKINRVTKLFIAKLSSVHTLYVGRCAANRQRYNNMTYVINFTKYKLFVAH